jgi:hypothetical protein
MGTRRIRTCFTCSRVKTLPKDCPTRKIANPVFVGFILSYKTPKTFNQEINKTRSKNSIRLKLIGAWYWTLSTTMQKKEDTDFTGWCLCGSFQMFYFTSQSKRWPELRLLVGNPDCMAEKQNFWLFGPEGHTSKQNPLLVKFGLIALSNITHPIIYTI